MEQINKRGLTIVNYLIDGDPEGVVFAYISNWSGQAIKIPRNSFHTVKSNVELQKPGVYFLIGFSKDDPYTQLVYIGQANNLSQRLSSHMTDDDKSFFELVIVFNSKDEFLTDSHTRYLEGKLITEANDKSNIQLLNKKEGISVNLSAMIRDEMDEYYDNLKILMPSLGYNLFSNSTRLRQTTEDEYVYITQNKGFKATAILTSNSIVVQKGSHFKPSDGNSLSEGNVRMRTNLRSSGIVKEEGGQMVFTKDYEFNSPSAAAVAVLGYSINGRDIWKNKSGTSINMIELEKLAVEIEKGLNKDISDIL